jgi:hypothetical protein
VVFWGVHNDILNSYKGKYYSYARGLLLVGLMSVRLHRAPLSTVRVNNKYKTSCYYKWWNFYPYTKVPKGINGKPSRAYGLIVEVNNALTQSTATSKDRLVSQIMRSFKGLTLAYLQEVALVFAI